MKKFLHLFFTLQVFSVATANAMPSYKMAALPVSDKEIGLDIDRSNAINNDNVTKKSTSNDTTNGVSNYYVVGDSLLDGGGFTKTIKENVGINAVLSGAYGSTQTMSKKLSVFTDNVPVSIQLGKLIFKNKDYLTEAAISKDDNSETFGNNYAIGGATANPDLIPWYFESEARALVAQHTFSDNDLVFSDMGGNDLFSIIDSTNSTDSMNYINKMVEGIKRSLLTMLNGGVKKILFMTFPEMLDVPKYDLALRNFKENNDDVSYNNLYNKITSLEKEAYVKMNVVLENIKNVYGSRLKVFDLFPYFADLVKNKDNEFYKENQNIISTGGYTFGFDLESNTKPKWNNDTKTVELVASPSKDATGKKVDDYMFIDAVHPTYPVVKYVANYIYDLIHEEGWVKDEKINF